jgi:hypothetical protein
MVGLCFYPVRSRNYKRDLLQKLLMDKAELWMQHKQVADVTDANI